MNISEFLSSLQKWSSCSATVAHSNAPIELVVFHKKPLLHPSYLVAFQSPSQTPAAIIPIVSKIALQVSDTKLIIKFNNYDGISIVFSVSDFHNFQVFVADIANCMTNSEVSDPFKDLNYQFLYKNQTRDDQVQNYIRNSTVQFSDPTTFLKNPGSIAVGIQQRSIWEQRIMALNAQFAAKLSDMHVSVITWNVASVKPHPIVIEEINKAFQCGNEQADFVFIALQEIDMGVVSIVAGSTGVSGKWSKIVDEAVQRTGGAYEVVSEETLGGVFAAVVVKKETKYKLCVHNVKTIRLGAYGIAANKGAAIFTCSVGCTRFVLIGCHLSPHTENWQQRNDQIHQLVKAVAGTYDYLIFVGDLNYRIALSYEETLSLINQNRIGTLLEHDQLRMTMQRDKIIGTMKEPPLQFMPTYKFDKDSAIYDTSPKKRVPSWTDRILIKRGPKRLSVGITEEPSLNVHQAPKLNFPSMPKCVAFRRGTCQFSDHRSVTCSYVFKVPLVDKERVEEVKKAIATYYSAIEIDATPKIELSTPSLSLQGGKMTINNASRSWIHWSANVGGSGMKLDIDSGLLFPNESREITITPSSSNPGGTIVFSAERAAKANLEITDKAPQVQQTQPKPQQPQQSNFSLLGDLTQETPKPVPQQPIDLFSTSPPASVNSTSNNTFDPFASFQPVQQPKVQPIQQQTNTFDPFGMNTPSTQVHQTQQANTFDPFGMQIQKNDQQQKKEDSLIIF